MNALRIGDKIPDITITKVLNYKSKSLKLSDFKGKLLILDFWATWCGACISSIPKMDILQKQFGDQIVILPVTYQTESVVDSFLAKLEKFRPEILTRGKIQIVEDTVLNRLFTHTGLPHYVWIDSKGVVQAITSHTDVTSANISTFLQKGRIETVLKQDDPRIPYSKEQPILSNLAGRSLPLILFQTLLSGYTAGLKGGMDILPADGLLSRKIVLRNSPLVNHFRTAFSDGKKWFGNSSIILDVKNPSKLEYPKNGDFNTWIRENGYCYELQLPKEHDSQIYNQMKEDLKRFFPNYEARIERRLQKVLALVRTSDNDKLASKGGKAESKFSGFGAKMQNIYLNMLTSQLSVFFWQNSPLPIVNETSYRGKVDIEIKADMMDLKAVNEELNKYDLQFIEKEKETEVLVIKDKI